jgi:hypothetical protein
VSISVTLKQERAMTSIRKKLLSVVFLATLTVLLLSLSGSALATTTTGNAQWARSTAAGAPDYSSFSGVSVDPSGNTYAVGFIGAGSFDFGNGVTVAGGGVRNTVMVKFDSSGLAQWAKSTAAGAAVSSSFSGVSVDASGNAYAVGDISGTGSTDFGNGVTVAGGYAGGNTVIVKYDSSGVAQWARSTAVGAPDTSRFAGVSVDASGNAYAAGDIIGTGSYDFGNGVTVAGGAAFLNNSVIVKYDSSGVAQWAKSTAVGAPSFSIFSGVSVDASGNAYAAGFITGTGSYDFGNGVTVVGGNAGVNSVIVKYDSSGVAQWARSTAAGAPDDSRFKGVSVDASGNAYAVGSISGTGSYDFGNGVTVVGGNDDNTVIVKYDSSGVALWAKSTAAAQDTVYRYSSFTGVSVDPSGNAYAAGYIYRTGPYDFGNGVTVVGGNAGGGFGWDNTVIVKYDSSGVTQWAKSTAAGAPDYSSGKGVSVDASGNAYAVGDISGTGSYDFGNGVTVAGGFSGTNSVIVKYSEEAVFVNLELPYTGGQPAPLASIGQRRWVLPTGTAGFALVFLAAALLRRRTRI